MFDDHNDLISEILLEANLISTDQLEEYKGAGDSSDLSLADNIVNAGLVTREQLLQASAEYLNTEYVTQLPDSVPDAWQEIVKSGYGSHVWCCAYFDR